MEPVFFLVFIAVVALIIWAFYAAAQRRKKLAAWAAQHGLSFDESHDSDFEDSFPGFDCLREGDSRYAYNVMRGDWGGLRIVAFDYHYATGSGKDRSDYHFSAAILGSPIPLKPLRIRAEGFLDKIGEFFGFDDIDFESAEFSRRFHVKAPDKRWAYDIIHQRTMAYLMSAPEFSVQFAAYDVIAWQSKTFEPADFEAAARHIRAILDLIPEYVVQQRTDRGQATGQP